MAEQARDGGAEARLKVQQDMLARFGAHALRHDDLDAILQESCRLVAEGLDEHYAKILQVVEGDERLLIRAAVGYGPMTPDEALLPGGTGSSGGYALLVGEPTLCADALTETRFKRAEVVARQGIRSMVNVPIADLGDGGRPWFGILEVDSKRPHAFTGDEINFLCLYANLLAAVIDGHQMRDRLRRALEAKERLLDELRHRVKNNLAVVTALARVQGARASGEETRRHLDAFARRVRALGLAYDTFHADDPVDRVEMRAYLGGLARELIDFHADGAKPPRRLDLDIAAVTFDAERAVPLGMILNEFVTNSLKYAFQGGQGGTIGVRLTLAGDAATLVLWDDGPGMATPPAPGKGGIGLTLIEGLARQIDAGTTWETGNGTRLSLRFRGGG